MGVLFLMVVRGGILLKKQGKTVIFKFLFWVCAHKVIFITGANTFLFLFLLCVELGGAEKERCVFGSKCGFESFAKVSHVIVHCIFVDWVVN